MENQYKNYRIYYYEDLLADFYSNILVKNIIAKSDDEALEIANNWCKENNFTFKELHLIIC